MVFLRVELTLQLPLKGVYMIYKDFLSSFGQILKHCNYKGEIFEIYMAFFCLGEWCLVTQFELLAAKMPTRFLMYRKLTITRHSHYQMIYNVKYTWLYVNTRHNISI